MSDVERTVFKDDDIFHAVTMAEDRTYQKGYEEGIEKGRLKGFHEGFKLGTQKGAELSKEIGFYAGYAAYVIKIYKDDSSKARLTKLCQSIIAMANDVCQLHPTDEKLTDSLNRLQSKFKQALSLLGVKLEYNTATGASRGISF